MNLTINQLTQMLSEAFSCGYEGTAEERESVITEILEKYKMRKEDDIPPPEPVKKEVDLRVYSVAELRELPVGTVFIHTTLGKCHINQGHSGKYMVFDNPGLAPSGFSVDGYPWEIPMQME